MSFVNFFTAQPPFEINKFNLRNEMCVQTLWHTLMRKLKTVIDSNHTKPARKTFMIEQNVMEKYDEKTDVNFFSIHDINRIYHKLIISVKIKLCLHHLRQFLSARL